MLSRIVVLYNTDYDAELKVASDVSAVEDSAKAIAGALGVTEGAVSQ